MRRWRFVLSVDNTEVEQRLRSLWMRQCLAFFLSTNRYLAEAETLFLL
jgi:hypothetical protein